MFTAVIFYGDKAFKGLWQNDMPVEQCRIASSVTVTQSDKEDDK